MEPFEIWLNKDQKKSNKKATFLSLSGCLRGMCIVEYS